MNTQITDELGEMIYQHLVHIQMNVSGCRQARFVVDCEANMGYAAPSVLHYFKTKVPNDFAWEMIEADPRTGNMVSSNRINPNRAIIFTAGTRTANPVKAQWVVTMTNLLRRNKVHFHTDFTSVQFDPDAPPLYADLRAAIVRQFIQYQRTTKLQKDPNRYPTITYSGREEDDLVTATLMLTWCFERYKTGANYRQSREAVVPSYL